jgi:hypothetical protein
LRECVQRPAISCERAVCLRDYALLQRDKFCRDLGAFGAGLGDRPLVLIHQWQSDDREELENVFPNFPGITTGQIDIRVLPRDFQFERFVSRGVLRAFAVDRFD